MLKIMVFFSVLFLSMLFFVPAVLAQNGPVFEEDIVTTSEGNLKITFIGHGSLMLSYKGKIIHVDPYSKLADYSLLPKADGVLITHQHQDHLDLKALEAITAENTVFVLNAKSAEILKNEKATVINNGEKTKILDIPLEATLAYNLVHKRDTGVPYHPKGEGNGYILTFGDKRIYIAGDTENFPEMKDIKNIDIAFLPMNLPYTMTPEMVRDAALVIKPKILYPYHYGDTDTNKLLELMKGEKNIQIKIRNMQ